MATVTAERQIPFDVPGHFGDYETYIELPVSESFLNFRNGETYSCAPTRGDVSWSAYVDRNIRPIYNEGQFTPPGMPPHMRTMFVKNAGIRESKNGGKSESDPTIIPLNQYTKQDADNYPGYMYNSKNGFGFISGEAGENEGPWKFQYDHASRQYKEFYQALTDYAKANPDKKIINGGMNYCTHSTIWPGKCNRYDCSDIVANYETLKNGFSSVDNARNLLAAFEWYFHRYWSGRLWETETMPLTNAYCTDNNNYIMFWKTILQVELAAIGLQGTAIDPRNQALFFWARALELQPYTEQYKVDLGNNVKMYLAEWPQPHPGLVYALARMGFRHCKHVQQWDNPYGYGKDPNIVCEAAYRVSYENGNIGGKQVVSQFNPVPNNNNVPVGYAIAPYGLNDMVAVAGKMHCKQTDFLNIRPTPVSWSINGQNGPAVDAGYFPYCIDNHKPLIRAAKDGNRAIVDIFDPEGWGGGSKC